MTYAALLVAGGYSASAGEPKSGAPDVVIALGAPRAEAPAGLLKTFNLPGADSSLNKALTLSDPAGARHTATESSKVTSTLVGVKAIPVPEPTALFLAGFAGCMLLALGQRLRGPKPSLR